MHDNAGYILDKIVAAGTSIHNKAPKSLRFVFVPLGFPLAMMRALWQDQWVLSGLEASSNQELVIRYTGIKENKNYIEQLAYGKEPEVSYLGKKWLWQTLKDTAKRQCDMEVAEIPYFLRGFVRGKGFLVPCWVYGGVDIPASLNLISKDDSLKNDQRKIRSHGLSFVMTRYAEHFDEFYHHMYVPYAGARWGKESIISDYDSLNRCFRNGFLILIKKEEQFIAGALVSFEKWGPALISSGVKDGKLEYVKLGALSATYYFTIKYIHEQGYQKAFLGYSRAFLKDGVLQHKKHWGLRVMLTRKPLFLIERRSDAAGARAFLLENPFICLDKDRLVGTVFVKDDISVTEPSGATRKALYLDGLSDFILRKVGQPPPQRR